MSTIIPTNKKKVNTIRASSKDDTCPFKLQFCCYKSGRKWYIKSQTAKFNGGKVGVHSGHLQIQSDHIPNKFDHLEPEVYNFIKKLKEQ